MNQMKYNTIAMLYLLLVLCCLAFVVATTGCAPGRTGDTGSPGKDQPPVSIITVPATLAECPTGGTDISIGTQLLTVCNGAVGATGAAGQDITLVTVVPLCPGVSNYGVFVEVALQIGDKLYAVYSQNGGFLTYLAPGNYTSDGIGAACNLTVNPDGTITH